MFGWLECRDGNSIMGDVRALLHAFSFCGLSKVHLSDSPYEVWYLYPVGYGYFSRKSDFGELQRIAKKGHFVKADRRILYMVSSYSILEAMLV